MQQEIYVGNRQIDDRNPSQSASASSVTFPFEASPELICSGFRRGLTLRN